MGWACNCDRRSCSRAWLQYKSLQCACTYKESKWVGWYTATSPSKIRLFLYVSNIWSAKIESRSPCSFALKLASNWSICACRARWLMWKSNESLLKTGSVRDSCNGAIKSSFYRMRISDMSSRSMFSRNGNVCFSCCCFWLNRKWQLSVESFSEWILM